MTGEGQVPAVAACILDVMARASQTISNVSEQSIVKSVIDVNLLFSQNEFVRTVRSCK